VRIVEELMEIWPNEVCDTDDKAIWLVVTIMPLLSEQRKSVVTSDLMDLRSLLILKICLSAHVIMMLELSWLMGMMICFLEGPLVVIFSFRHDFWLVL